MARKIIPLTATQIKQAKPKNKELKLFDGGGLFLLVTTTGSKLWRLKYKFENKEKTISLGRYPDISLSKARELRENNRQLIAGGVNPSELRKAEKLKTEKASMHNENKLTKIANEFFEHIENTVTPKYLKKLKSYFNNHISSPSNKINLGNHPITEITRTDILTIIDEMNKKGIYESAKKTLNLLERIYKFAVTREYVEHNIIADFEKKLLLKKKEVKHHATFTDSPSIKLLLESIDKYEGEITTKYALKLIIRLALRPIEIRSMKWEYINFDDNIIIIPADKMKMRREHLVPITPAVKQILKELQVFTGDGVYLFPNTTYKDRFISENTMNVALRRMGFEKDMIVSHGFRSMFSTIANDSKLFREEVIEIQMAHNIGNSVSRAYNRAKYLEERVELMQWWSDYLDEVKGAI